MSIEVHNALAHANSSASALLTLSLSLLTLGLLQAPA